MTLFAAEFVPSLVRASCALAVAALAIALLIRMTRIRSTAVQQTLWLLVLLQGVVVARIPVELPWTTSQPLPVPITSTAVATQLAAPTPTDRPEVATTPPVDALPFEPVVPTTTRPRMVTEPAGSGTSWSWHEWTALLWVLGATGLVAFGLSQYVIFCRSVRQGSPAEPDWREQCRAVLSEAGIKRTVPLIVTDSLGPALCRLPRGSVFVVPESGWRSLSSDQRRNILLHEAAHVRRGDLWTSLLARLLAAMQWFNPCSWWALARFQTCAEWACDDAAAATVGHANYARTLMHLGSNPQRPISFVHAAQTGTLFTRIQRVLTTSPLRDSVLRRVAVLFVAVALLLVAGTRVSFVAPGLLSADDSIVDDGSDPVQLPVRALMELGDRRLRHREFVRRAIFSPDGRYIASVSANVDSGIRVWSAQTGRQEMYLVPPDLKWGSVKSIAFSPDSRYLVAGENSGQVSVWDVENEVLLSRTEQHEHSVNSVTFRPGSTEFATGGDDGWIRVFDLSAPADEVWFHVTGDVGPRGGGFTSGSFGIIQLAFTPDGSRLIAGVAKSTSVLILDADTGALERQIEQVHGGGSGGPLDDSLQSISITPDGERIITSGFRRIPRHELPEGQDYYAGNVQIGEIRVWDTETGAQLADLTEDEFTVSFGYTALSPDGSLVACCDFDSLRFRDPETGEVIRSIPIPGSWGAPLSFSPDGAFIAVPGGNDVSVWNIRTGERMLNDPASHDSYVRSAAWSPAGDLLVTAASDGSINAWNAISGEHRWRRVMAPDSRIRSVEFSPDGSRVIAAGVADDEIHQSHGTIVVWSAAGDEVSRFQTEKDPETLAVSPDGAVVAVPQSHGSIGDTYVDIWQLDPPLKLARFPRDADSGMWDCEHLAFAPDGQGLWTVEGNSHVTRWDLGESDGDYSFDADWRTTDELRDDNGEAWLGSAAFAPDGVLLVTSSNASLFLWELSSGELRGTIPVPEVAKYFRAIEVGPDSRTLAAAEVIYAGEPGTDTIRLFDLATQEQIVSLEPDNSRAACFAFSPDMQRMVSGLNRGTAIVWDLSR